MLTSKSLLGAAFVLSALVPSVAQAASPPKIAALPEVTLPDMLHPKDSPASLPATETIEGIRVTQGHQRNFGSVEATDGGCITMGALAPRAVPSGNSSVMIRASSSALPMRAEKFVGAESGKPELVITDGWVDMNSSGMHSERTTHVPLTSIGRGPAGYTIYGFRSDGKVHVVFPTPQRFVYVDTFGKFGFVSCQHTRLVLDPAANSASLVRVAGTLETHKPKPKAPSIGTLSASQPTQLRGIEATVTISRTKRDKEPLLSVTATWTEDERPPMFMGNPQDFDVAIPVEVDDLGSMRDE